MNRIRSLSAAALGLTLAPVLAPATAWAAPRPSAAHPTAGVVCAAAPAAAPNPDPGGGSGGGPTLPTTPAPTGTPVTYRGGGTMTVSAGQLWTVPATVRLHRLTVAAGGHITVPQGKSITLTVNGVETGQRLVTTAGAATTIAPGTYRGDVVLTVTDATSTTFMGLVFPIRQALRVGAGGVVGQQSVAAAIRGGSVTNTAARGIHVTSTGEAFNGVWVDDAAYQLLRPTIRMTGNGRYDFAGDGAAVVASGAKARLVVDRARIDTTGAVRTGLIATNGASVVVKNSSIRTHDGTLPADFTPTLFPGQMRSAPWMLGVTGNVRATNLVGANTRATYVASSISSTGWGVLSTDSTSNGRLTSINSTATTGSEGYGAYADGQTVTDCFLGTRFRVADYGLISTGGTVYYDDSTRPAVAQLNRTLSLGLSERELQALRPQATTVTSKRFGVMWHGGGAVVPAGTVHIGGHTAFDTGQTAFVDKGLQVTLDIDGSQGARVHAANGVLFQLMESDDPGPVMKDGALVNQGVYHEPTTAAVKDSSFDVTAAHATDATANLTDVHLRGDVFNGMRTGRNVVLHLTRSSIQGVLSSSVTRHAKDTITAADYRLISEVSNRAGATTNNGVVVDLGQRSSWTVTGTSYVSSLSLAPSARVTAPRGHRVQMTVNGVATPIVAGHTYRGAVVLTVQ